MVSVGMVAGLIPAIEYDMHYSAITGTAVGCGSSEPLITDLSPNG